MSYANFSVELKWMLNVALDFIDTISYSQKYWLVISEINLVLPNFIPPTLLMIMLKPGFNTD